MTLFLFGLFFVLLLFELPVAFAIGVSSSVAVLFSERLPPTFIVSKIFAGLDSFPLMAIPFYVLAGNLMSEGGLTQKIVSFANALVGHVRGGLAHVSIVSAAIFSGVSGSAAADTAAIGSIMIPAMKKEGYASDFAVCVVASACTMGPIIPPSILFIVYGSLVQVSVGQLFLAGFLPGLIMMVTLMAFAAVIVRKRGYAASHARFLVRRAVETLIGAGCALLVPVIIIGGIVGGWFTPTEAGVIAVVYALLVSMLVLRTVRITDVPRIFVESAMMTAIVMLILGPATVFGSLLIRDHFPDKILAALAALTSNATLSVFLMIGFIIAAGFVIDVMVLIIMLAYPFAQVAGHYGYDPIHFGLVFTLAATIGGITPPVGSLLFVACSIGRIGLSEASRAIWPFVVALVLVNALLIVFPALTTIVPKLFFE
jgi:tripartite ATP-independent transporter DctM subunit